MSQFYREKKTVFIAGTALLAAVVVVLDYSRLKVPYPGQPFLKFDALGIPMLLSYFIFGLLSGTITSVVAWLSIAPRDPFSGFMKFLAEFSTIIGVYVVLRARRPTGRFWKALSLASGVTVRVVVTTIANILLLPVFMPTFYQSYAAVVISVPSFGVFNAIQGTISVLGGFMVYEAVAAGIPALKRE